MYSLLMFCLGGLTVFIVLSILFGIALYKTRYL